MKKPLLLFILLAAVITGCAQKSGNNADNLAPANTGAENQTVTLVKKSDSAANSPEKEYIAPEMKGEITISVLDAHWDFLNEGADMFMDRYPDVTVTINAFRSVEPVKLKGGAEMSGTPSEEFSTENYLSLLNTKIMTGKAEDIIMTDSIPLRKYTEMGAFEDLSFYLAHSPEINEESHNMNVFEIMKDKNGRIYEIPLIWSPYDIIYFDKTLVADSGLFLGDGVKTMSYKEALEYAKNLVDSTDRNNTFLTMGKSSLHAVFSVMNDSFEDFIDEENKKVNIDNERFISILNWAKDLEDQGYYDTQQTIDFYNMEYYFAFGNDYGIQAVHYALHPDTDRYHSMPVSDGWGNVNASAPFRFGINSASKSKELAWEFIKFLLSDEVQTLPSFFGPGVNKKGFDATVERQLKFYNDGSQSNVSKQEYEELLKSWVSQINSYRRTDQMIINEFLYPEIEKFFKEGQSAEDTARIIQSKLDKYLNE